MITKRQWKFDKLFSDIINEMTVGSVFMNAGPGNADPMQGDAIYAGGNTMRPNILGTNFNIGDDLKKASKKKKKKIPVARRGKIAM
tara:strand:- start:633 stop:890 length:258 start_codon:yes stop_codon:yes gene_type:complete